MARGVEKSLRLSPKHGVNPSLQMCWLCGKDTNDILLLGRMDAKDSEAPRKIARRGEFCDTCKGYMEAGIILALSYEGEYPAGPFVVVTEECVRRLFSAPMAEGALKHRFCFVDEAVMEIFQPSDSDSK